jgi:integrase
MRLFFWSALPERSAPRSWPLEYQQIKIGEHGAVIQIPRSKTDQEGRGRTILVARTPEALCSVAALQRWLLKAGITKGPVFRPLMRNGKLREGSISPGAIAGIVKQRISEMGRDPTCYSGHSLRAGFATEAARLGVSKWRIKAQTGHASDSALERYIRERELHSSDMPNVLAASAERDALSEAHRERRTGAIDIFLPNGRHPRSA